MFFFGIFSTHIPYLILTVLYLVGFGAYSANRVKEKSDSGSEKTIQLSQKNQTVSHLYRTFYFHQKVSKTQQVIQTASSSRIIHFISYWKHNYIEKYSQYYSLQLIFSLFSRPPPTCLNYNLLLLLFLTNWKSILYFGFIYSFVQHHFISIYLLIKI